MRRAVAVMERLKVTGLTSEHSDFIVAYYRIKSTSIEIESVGMRSLCSYSVDLHILAGL